MILIYQDRLGTNMEGKLIVKGRYVNVQAHQDPSTDPELMAR
jgi:hypothetical protein